MVGMRMARNQKGRNARAAEQAGSGKVSRVVSVHVRNIADGACFSFIVQLFAFVAHGAVTKPLLGRGDAAVAA